MKREFTPDNIQELEKNKIFVFGSNMNGKHAGGAAKFAVEKFGAIEGQSEGLQGQSYAVPTLGKDMEKLPLESISQSVDDLYSFADENADLIFVVTKIGCGIAGFSETEIADIFKSKSFTPFNVVLPMEFSIIKGVKGFDKNMQCRGMQFEENKEFHQDGTIKACENGVHFCENPLQTLRYYSANNSEFCEVEGHGNLDSHIEDSKIAVSDIKIKGKIKLPQLLELGFEFTRKQVGFFRKRADILISKNTSDSSVNSGLDYSVNSGRDYSVNSGRNSSVNSGLDYSVNSGLDYSVCAGRFYSEIKLEGKNSFGIAGKDSKIKGKIGCAICLVEYNRNNDIIGVKSALVDGEIIKEDVYYKLINGEFVGVE